MNIGCTTSSQHTKIEASFLALALQDALIGKSTEAQGRVQLDRGQQLPVTILWILILVALLSQV